MSFRKRTRRLLIALVAFGYFCVLLTYTSWWVGGADSSGYLNSARLLARGQVTDSNTPLEVLDLEGSWAGAFVPLGFITTRGGGRLAPVYPPGLPVHMLVAAQLLGWELGPYLVSPAAAVIGLLLVYLLARELGLSRAYAGGVVAALSVWAPYLYQGIQPMSDVVAMGWCVAAMLGAFRSEKGSAWAVLGGFAAAVAVAIRPTSILMALPMVAVFDWRPRRALAVIAGGVVPGTAFLAYNTVTYGSAFRTGYGGVLGADLGWHLFPDRFVHYTTWLGVTLTPLVLLLWISLPFVRGARWRVRAGLFLWFGAFFAFYTCYRHHDAWWYMRFLLPAVPALLIGAAITLQEALRQRQATTRTLVAAAVAAIVIGNAVHQSSRLEVFGVGALERSYGDAAELMRQRLPEKAFVLSMHVSGAVRAYTPFTPVRYDLLDAAGLEHLRRLTEPLGYHWYAAIYPFEEPLAAPRVGGDWRRVGSAGPVRIYRLRPEYNRGRAQ